MGHKRNYPNHCPNGYQDRTQQNSNSKSFGFHQPAHGCNSQYEGDGAPVCHHCYCLRPPSSESVAYALANGTPCIPLDALERVVCQLVRKQVWFTTEGTGYIVHLSLFCLLKLLCVNTLRKEGKKKGIFTPTYLEPGQDGERYQDPKPRLVNLHGHLAAVTSPSLLPMAMCLRGNHAVCHIMGATRKDRDLGWVLVAGRDGREEARRSLVLAVEERSSLWKKQLEICFA